MGGDVTTVSERLIYTDANEKSCDPVELPALYETIDPDILDRLIESLSAGKVYLSYANLEVTIHAHGEITV